MAGFSFIPPQYRQWLPALLLLLALPHVSAAGPGEGRQYVIMSIPDSLLLPSQLPDRPEAGDAILVYIVGSTTYHEKGHQAATYFQQDRADKHNLRRQEKFEKLEAMISGLPWQGYDPLELSECFEQARQTEGVAEDAWFKLGLLLYDNGEYENSRLAFSRANTTDFQLRYAAMVWLGHLCDIHNNRHEAFYWYKKALAHYNGIAVQHDQWGLQLDKNWIRARISQPFKASLTH